MSAVEALAMPELAPEVPADIDAELSALYDKNITQNGAERAEDGKFTSPNPPEAEEPQVEDAVETPESVLEGAEAGEADGEDGSTLSAPSVPLPANWNGKEEVWAKVPPELQPEIAAIQGELQQRLTQQGRQIAETKPLTDALGQYRHLFEGRIDPVEGIKNLARAQEQLENPNTRYQALMGIIDSFGARDAVYQLLTGQAQLPASQPQQPQVNVDRVVEAKLTERMSARDAESAISMFAQSNPMWNEINEEQQTNYTRAAKIMLPSAPHGDVLKRALNLAIEDTPALKARMMAAAKPAVVPKPVSSEAAKRANSVNVPSTATGKVREPSEDELLSAIYERNQRG